MGLNIALKAFWSALTSNDVADRFSEILCGDNTKERHASSPVKLIGESSKDPVSCKPVQTTGNADNNRSVGRSEALELLSTLQREARFVDFIEESLDGCDDSDIGAAARNVHDRCKLTLERLFEIRPLSEVREGENTSLSVKEIQNSTRFQTSSSVGKQTTSVGMDEKVSVKVVHSGWRATKCSLPQWSGAESDKEVLAPVEIELQ